MEFRILGPLQVWSGGRRIALGGPQAEKALAVLLLAGGHVVSLDAMIDALWDGESPATAKHQVHKVVGNLRQRLPGVIETDGPGYGAVLAESTLDAKIFAERAAVPTIRSLTAALDLWRGPALAGIDSRALQASAATTSTTDFRGPVSHIIAITDAAPGSLCSHPSQTVAVSVIASLLQQVRVV